MILFWVICAAFILIALVFVLPPALQRSTASDRKNEDERRHANIAVYRDQLSELDSDLKNGIVSQEQYAQDREEIERRLLEDTRFGESEQRKTTPASARHTTAYAIGIAIPLVSVTFYLNVGAPKAIDSPPPTVVPRGSSGLERSQEQIDANVAALAKRLQSNPADAQGWAMLARSYSSMGKFAEAAGAYTKATELTPNDGDLWAEFAFATAMASGRNLEGRPMELINHALKVDPENAKALQLAGSAAFQSKDYKKAIDYWQRVLKGVPPGSEVAVAIQGRIDEAKTLAANK